MHVDTRLDVVVGGQFGSESKGRVTLDVIRKRLSQGHVVFSVRVAGPNAGHVVIDEAGHRWAMRQLPVGFVEPSAVLFIGPGSEIDRRVLASEIEAVEAAGYEVRDRLYIHPEATYLEPHHIVAEKHSDLTKRLGSTAKGIGAARADRIWRTARRVSDVPALFENLGRIRNPAPVWNAPGWAWVIEGTQGYGLGLHAGHYPYCTSSNARAIDFCAMAGVTPWDLPDIYDSFRVWVVVRPNPIRVAGNSGELAGETSWTDLGLEAERTTVTQKIRRVGQFDPSIVNQAIYANGHRVVRIALAMADQVAPALAGATEASEVADLEAEQAMVLRDLVEKIPVPYLIRQIGTGPSTHIDLTGDDLFDLLDAAVAAGAEVDL